jgi:predicted DNA-binding transcriptional regulator YafY
MPNNSTRNTLLRQWELLKTLPSRPPGKTARELTRALVEFGFPVTKRTVERDLENLAAVFPIECNDKGRPFGWYWAPGAAADLPGITLADAVSLRMIEETLKPLMPATVLSVVEPRLRQATSKLERQRKKPGIYRWADKVRNIPPTLPLLPPVIDSQVLETVQSALLYEVQLELDYLSMDAETPHTLTLHPLALVQRGSVTYLLATASGYRDIRTYALHRINRAQRLPGRVKTPPGFDLDHHLKSGALQFGNGKFIKLKAMVDEWLVRILKETPLSADQVLKTDGEEHLLTATVADSWQLRWWILSQGAAMRVTQPRPLRQEIERTLSTALRRYEAPITRGKKK